MLKNVSLPSNTAPLKNSVEAIVKTLTLSEALERHLFLKGFNDNLFMSQEWLRVLMSTYQLKLFVKYIEKDGSPTSWIIYSVVRNFLEWKICVCSYCDYFDCYLTGERDWNILFESLRKKYPRYRIAMRNLRDPILRNSGNLKLLSREKYHVLDTRPD